MTELVECNDCKNKGDVSAKTCKSCGSAVIKTYIEQKIDAMKPEKTAKWLLWLALVAFFIIAGILALYWINFGSPSIDPKDWGEFGGYFGGTLSPILSFLSLMALLFTIILQSKELELTREELKRSADAQVDTKKILEKQSATLTKQQFENTFFSLLNQHNNVLEKIAAPLPANDLKSNLDLILEHVYDYKILELSNANQVMKENNNLCGQYFRVLYQLLKFVYLNMPDSETVRKFEADSVLNDRFFDNEKMYSNIVRSFLNDSITPLLAVNCYCTAPMDTYWMYKCLIERYEFLEHMPFQINQNVLFKQVIDVYDIRAFGKNEYVRKFIAERQASLFIEPVE